MAEVATAIPGESQNRKTNYRSGAWPRHVRVEAASILHRLSIAQSQAVAVAAPQAPDSSHPVNDEAVEKRRAASAHAIRSLAHVALETVDHRPRWSPSSLIDWWRGTSIEQAYRSLHAARVFLVEVLTPTEVKELAPTVQARICASLPATDSRRLILEQLPNVKDPAVLVARVQAGLEMIYDGSIARPSSQSSSASHTT